MSRSLSAVAALASTADSERQVFMAEDWLDINADPVHVKRERARARDLRATENVGAENLTMDHVIPVARGGRSTRGNCVPCCKECNNSKKAYTPAEQILNRLFNIDT